jgi:hypothetical protein
MPLLPRNTSGVPITYSKSLMRLLKAELAICSRLAAPAMVPNSMTLVKSCNVFGSILHFFVLLGTRFDPAYGRQACDAETQRGSVMPVS